MKKLVLPLAVLVAAAGTIVAVRAADQHPDSKRDALEDGCNRSQLALLGEAAATMKLGPHPTGFSSWVYVKGDNTPQTLVGEVLGTHTAGTDLFGVHDTYDLNIDVKPDEKYERLLSSRNAEEDPKPVGQIHTEWESGLAPLFAWPDSGDRVRETGSQIWDCGHWQDGEKTVPSGDLVPGDPLGSAGDVVPGDPLHAAGIERAEGEEIEIHPIMELATWRAHGDFVPQGARAPVHAAQLDVAISNQGGKAKGVEECALISPRRPARARRAGDNPTCSTIQDVTGRNYEYVLAPPGPKPSPASTLLYQYDYRYSHHGPGQSDVTFEVKADGLHITVPFARLAKSTDVQDFGATFHAWWSDDGASLHRFRVTQTLVRIFNNMDGDTNDNAQNPLISPNGEWNMFTDVGGTWTNLHDPRPGHVDYAPELGSVPSAKAAPVDIRLNGAAGAPPVPATDITLPTGSSLHLFTDARECDQPGYVDCPTSHDGVEELAASGRSSGRGDILLPVNQLAGRTTIVDLHPLVCNGPNLPPCRGEQDDAKALCGQDSCYLVEFRIDDIQSNRRALKLRITGDGTATGTTVGAVPAGQLSWWLDPPTKYAPDEAEEYVHVARVVAGMNH